MRLIDADVLMEILTTAIRNMKGVAKFIGTEDDSEIQMEIKAYTDIAKGVKNMPTIDPEPQKWIPCSERLPEILETVLVTCRKAVKHKTRKYNYSIKSAWHVYYPEINFTKWHFHNTSKNDAERLDVIAWMPMPKPYKGEE